MIKLTKDMFSCWGNGDKYDDELIIEHDPKIESKTIADQILENQKLRGLIEKRIKLLKRDKIGHFNYEINMIQNLLKESKK